MSSVVMSSAVMSCAVRALLAEAAVRLSIGAS